MISQFIPIFVIPASATRRAGTQATGLAVSSHLGPGSALPAVRDDDVLSVLSGS
jgi:hypothetical protein